VEIFGWNFSANVYSLPDGRSLSSGALVTTPRLVQLSSVFVVQLDLDL
jgi:hypothetical protein